MSAGPTALPVTMKVFKRLVKSVSPDVSIVVRGRHGIGKSESVYQIGADLGLPVVERRLSQMTEGDIVGLPFMNGKDEFNEEGKQINFASTQFKPCDWLIQGVKQPVLLFLDERNRALDGVKQAVFQLADSKAFYGYKLHPDTRIIIAENYGDEYQIQACDPAETSRSILVILTPSPKDWLDYADGKCHPATIEFIRQNERLLEAPPPWEADKKYPDRRAWFKLDNELRRLDLFDNPEDSLLYQMAGAFVGVEAAGKFAKFCKEREREVKAEDILENWAKTKKRLAGKATISNEAYVECVAKLSDFLVKEENTLKVGDKRAEQLGKFMYDCPGEPRMACWSMLQRNTKNLFATHPHIEKLMVKTAQGEETADLQQATKEKAAKTKAKTAKKKNEKDEDKNAETKQRGARRRR